MESILPLSFQRVKCGECNKYFVNNSVLRKHINAIHKNIKLFQCEYKNCERKFRTSYRLYVHKWAHEGKKPFTCDVCNKSFAEKGTLKVHSKSHSSVCDFECEICHIGYRNESHLREHYKMKHFKFNFYKCKICAQRFNFKSDYLYHVKWHYINSNLGDYQSIIEMKSTTKDNSNNWAETDSRTNDSGNIGCDIGLGWYKGDYCWISVNSISFEVVVI